MTLQAKNRTEGKSAAPAELCLYKVDEVVEILAHSRSVVYELIRSGRLRSVNEGRARRISASAIADYIALLEHEAMQGAA